jgi:hypothetical protein
MGGYLALPPNIAAALAAFDRRVQNTRDGLQAQAAWNKGDFARVISIILANPNVGISVNGLQLWGALAVAFVNGYSQPIEIAQRFGLPPGAQAYAIRKGWEAVAHLLQKLRGPDFLVVNYADGMQFSFAISLRGIYRCPPPILWQVWASPHRKDRFSSDGSGKPPRPASRRSIAS